MQEVFDHVLVKIGLGWVADKPMVQRDGVTPVVVERQVEGITVVYEDLKVEDYPLIMDPAHRADRAFLVLAAMPEDHPKYEEYRTGLIEMIRGHTSPDLWTAPPEAQA